MGFLNFLNSIKFSSGVGLGNFRKHFRVFRICHKRSKFTQSITLKQHICLFQCLIYAGRLLGGSFLYFNKHNTCLCSENNNPSATRRLQIIHRLLYFHIASIAFGSIYNLIFLPHQDLLTSIDKIIFAFTITVSLATTIFQTHINTHSNIACLYVNGLLTHLQRFPMITIVESDMKRPLRLSRVVNLLLAYSIVPVSTAVPMALVLGYYWYFPCNPGFSGFFLLPECWEHDACPKQGNPVSMVVQNTTTKLLLAYLNLFCWSCSTQSSTSGLASILILCQMSVSDLLKM